MIFITFDTINVGISHAKKYIAEYSQPKNNPKTLIAPSAVKFSIHSFGRFEVFVIFSSKALKYQSVPKKTHTHPINININKSNQHENRFSRKALPIIIIGGIKRKAITNGFIRKNVKNSFI
jgi:hypothetical protein